MEESVRAHVRAQGYYFAHLCAFRLSGSLKNFGFATRSDMNVHAKSVHRDRISPGCSGAHSSVTLPPGALLEFLW